MPLVTDRLPREAGEFAFMRVTHTRDDGKPLVRGVVDVLNHPEEPVHGMHIMVPDPEVGADSAIIYFAGTPFTTNAGAQWQWDGNYTHPTLHPSIDVREGEGDGQKTVWHGYLRGGELVLP